MTIADQQIIRLDRGSTSGSRTIVASTALAVALLCAQYASSDGTVADPDISLSGTAETNSRLQSLTIGEVDIAKQISRVYDELLRSQKEIDPETRAALYANLSDLYA
ncbi:MAG TPA: hypothetical protein VFG23_11210 [Polyangia bacterium]|nr:hypothetical protein [Polyangia bacterium]